MLNYLTEAIIGGYGGGRWSYVLSVMIFFFVSAADAVWRGTEIYVRRECNTILLFVLGGVVMGWVKKQRILMIPYRALG